jgi:hypothetical protein
MVPPNVGVLGRVTVIFTYRHRHAANLPEHRHAGALLAVVKPAVDARSGDGRAVIAPAGQP